MKRLNLTVMGVGVAALLIGALTGCGYSAAALATFGSILVARLIVSCASEELWERRILAGGSH